MSGHSTRMWSPGPITTSQASGSNRTTIGSGPSAATRNWNMPATVDGSRTTPAAPPERTCDPRHHSPLLSHRANYG
jgi:hypothetical protein